MNDPDFQDTELDDYYESMDRADLEAQLADEARLDICDEPTINIDKLRNAMRGPI